MFSSRLVSRNVMGARGRTSMRLEPELWDALDEMCLRENITLKEMMRCIAPASTGGRTSVVRVQILLYYRAAATEEGHIKARHGTVPLG
jgi:predicted DNA-binding ribbon-helix-helix protein